MLITLAYNIVPGARVDNLRKHLNSNVFVRDSYQTNRNLTHPLTSLHTLQSIDTCLLSYYEFVIFGKQETQEMG